MTTRMKLLLTVAACILCIVIVLSTDTSHRPFARLSADDLCAVDIETALGVTAAVSDPAELHTFAALLKRMTIIPGAATEDDALAGFLITAQDGKSYELLVYDELLCLDGTFCAVSAAYTEELLNFAKRFA